MLKPVQTAPESPVTSSEVEYNNVNRGTILRGPQGQQPLRQRGFSHSGVRDDDDDDEKYRPPVPPHRYDSDQGMDPIRKIK